MKIIVFVIVSWFFQLIVVGENTYNGSRVIANTNNGKKTPTTAVVELVTPTRVKEQLQKMMWNFSGSWKK